MITIEHAVSLIKTGVYSLHDTSTRQQIKHALNLIDEGIDILMNNVECDYDSIKQQAKKIGRGLNPALPDIIQNLHTSLISSSTLCSLIQDLLTYTYILKISDYKGYSSSQGIKLLPGVKRY